MSGGDAALFDAFVRAESTSLLKLAWGLTGERGAAEDLVQVALLRVWTHWPRVREKDRAGAYARRVTVSIYLTSRRRLWWGERASAAPPEDAVDDASEGVVTRRAVISALSALPAKQRAVVVLRYLDDRSEAETAEALGCSAGTVKSHAARGLAALRASPQLADSSAVIVDGDTNG